VVHYYENVRIVYEVESRVREIKRNVVPAEPGRKQNSPAKPKDDKNDTTQQPEQKQERNYSQSNSNLVLACAPLGPSVIGSLNQGSLHQDSLQQDLPVVSVTTDRRLI
jgi:hypothetical protein